MVEVGTTPDISRKVLWNMMFSCSIKCICPALSYLPISQPQMPAHSSVHTDAATLTNAMDASSQYGHANVRTSPSEIRADFVHKLQWVAFQNQKQ